MSNDPTLRFRALERGDFAMLASWLEQPHVARWWRDPSDARSVEARYGPSVDGRDPTEMFVVEADGEPVAFIQRYQSGDEPEWRRMLDSAGLVTPAIGIDYLIGATGRTGTGLGPAMIAAFVAGCWERYPSASVVAVAVQQENRPSWRALEKAGFRRAWSGRLDSDDPSDDGPSYLYLLARENVPPEVGITGSGARPPR